MMLLREAMTSDLKILQLAPPKHATNHNAGPHH